MAIMIKCVHTSFNVWPRKQNDHRKLRSACKTTFAMRRPKPKAYELTNIHNVAPITVTHTYMLQSIASSFAASFVSRCPALKHSAEYVPQ